MKSHELIRDKSFRFPEKCGLVSQTQRDASHQIWFLGYPICDSKQLPQRMPTEIIIFLAVGKRGGEERALSRSQTPVMKKPFLSKGSSGPALHAGSGNRYPVDPPGTVWDISPNFLETPASKELATTGDVVLTLETVGCRTVAFFPENGPCNSKTDVLFELS